MRMQWKPSTLGHGTPSPRSSKFEYSTIEVGVLKQKKHTERNIAASITMAAPGLPMFLSQFPTCTVNNVPFKSMLLNVWIPGGVSADGYPYSKCSLCPAVEGFSYVDTLEVRRLFYHCLLKKLNNMLSVHLQKVIAVLTVRCRHVKNGMCLFVHV